MQTSEYRRGVTTGLLALVVGSAMSVAWAPETASATPPENEVDVAAPGDQLGTVSLDLSDLRAMAMKGGAPNGKKDDKPAWKDVSEGFEKVISTADGQSFFGLWIDRKKNQVLAEMPQGWERQKHFIAMTVAGGEIFAGLQGRDLYVQWKKINDQMALVLPQLDVRSTGEQGTKDSVNMIFTDRVLMSMPIVTSGPSGQPVIDLDGMLVGSATKFFGGSAAGLQSGLTTIEEIKAFPQNVEISVKGPVGASGAFKTFHYSISNVQGTAGFKPRKADERVGFFTTSYEDFGKYDWDEVDVRYANRWHIEKADPKLKLSPPKEPVVYYVEHTVPVRYRRWVREGIEYWNDAFREIGIDGAIEVRYQDSATGAHMEKDPEDVRYNFIRWLNNNVATAIGPSRVNPETGEILDADVVLTDGWFRVFTYRWEKLLPDLAMEGMSPETLSWLERNPRWDPRVRLATPADREQLLIERSMRAPSPFGGHAAASVDPMLLGDDQFDGLYGASSQTSGFCQAAHGKALGLAEMRMYLEALDVILEAQTDAVQPEDEEVDEETLEMLRKQLEQNPRLIEMLPEKYKRLLSGEQPEGDDDDDDDAEGDEEGDGADEAPGEDEEQMLDGNPEWFVGPMLAELVAHEVGHTIGLRHNFKGSSYWALEDINSGEVKGEEPWSMSVMDYNGVNIWLPGYGEEQGDYSVIDIGPYDYWAIEYGYGFGDPEEVAKRASDPKLQYGTDEDTWGPDPYARRYDLASDPLTYAKNKMALANVLRESLLEHFVEDGDSWSRARQGYQITLSQQTSALSMMANWVGSAHVYRDKKGDPDGRAPIEVVEAAKQRDALNWVIENSFTEEAFGLTPDLLVHLTLDKWWDTSGLGDIFTDPTYQIHDTILGVQASVMTMLMNPTTLQRVYDLEKFVPASEDALTMAEIMETVTTEAWGELDGSAAKRFTAREPMISSIRRNLQREHIDRLIDMSMDTGSFSSAGQAVKTLATQTLRDLHDKVEGALSNGAAGRVDPYTRAHLGEIQIRIAKALDAQFIYNADDIRGGGFPTIFFGQETGNADGR